jgi:hypothetical protein
LRTSFPGVSVFNRHFSCKGMMGTFPGPCSQGRAVSMARQTSCLLYVTVAEKPLLVPVPTPALAWAPCMFANGWEERNVFPFSSARAQQDCSIPGKPVLPATWTVIISVSESWLPISLTTDPQSGRGGHPTPVHRLVDWREQPIPLQGCNPSERPLRLD